MNRLFGFGIFPVLIIALANVAAAQLVLYVSPDGNDAWSGSFSLGSCHFEVATITSRSPFASLHTTVAQRISRLSIVPIRTSDR